MNIRTALPALLIVAAPHIARAEDTRPDDCPEAFRGAAISATPVYDGVSLTFTTNAERIPTLRSELREVAMMLEQKGTEFQTSSYDEAVEFPPVELDVTDVEGGARVRVRASRPRDIPELRELATSFEKYWQTSPCHGDLNANAQAETKKSDKKRAARPSRRPSREARR